MISGVRLQSYCGGQCGWRWNASYNSHWQEDLGAWRGDGYEHAWIGGGAEDAIDGEAPSAMARQRRRLVCVMPKQHADLMVGFHQNCVFDRDAMAVKSANMWAWRNWTAVEPASPEAAALLHPRATGHLQPSSPKSGGSHAHLPPAVYVITVWRHDRPAADLSRLFVSLDFDMIGKWIVVHDSVEHWFPRMMVRSLNQTLLAHIHHL